MLLLLAAMHHLVAALAVLAAVSCASEDVPGRDSGAGSRRDAGVALLPGPVLPSARDAAAIDSGVDAAIIDAAIDDAAPADASVPDAAPPDAASPDAAPPDAAPADASVPDAAPPDAASPDAAPPDAAPPDASVPDAAPPDAAPPDAAPPDAAVPDAAAPDAALGECVPLPPTEPSLTPTVPSWVVGATVGSFPMGPGSSASEIDDMLAERVAEGVSVLEIDSGLSDYLSESDFATQVSFLTTVATKAHAHGLRAVIYYPSLEVITPNGANIAHTMYKDHPDWVQVGIDGTPNVFYGNQEVWVDDDDESAWMSPNTPYRDYFLGRVAALAGTGLDGIWADVPVYLSTGTKWAGAEPAAAAAFLAATGHSVPSSEDVDDPVFRSWVAWRHENLADFIESIRLTGLSVNPEFVTIIEDFPCDNRDATAVGLDGPYRVSGDNFIRVWEIDSVSNSLAMENATYEDFNSKIAMNKWALAMERGNPTWAFSYGHRAIDAGLTLAAAVTTGVVPFEAQTPNMTQSADSALRTRWFNFVRDHAEALLSYRRYADVGVWYSSPTRDFSDPGDWGMYITTENPTFDDDWWADHIDDSALGKPHLGGWRGAAHVLTQLGIGYEVVSEPGDPTPQLAELELVWLPSVSAMSDEHAAAIREFALAGGVVVATGALPATLDETGAARDESALSDLFGSGLIGPVSHDVGNGLAIYRPDLRGVDMYELAGGDATTAIAQTAAMEDVLRAHLPEVLSFEGGPGIHVELTRPSADLHYLYALNYTGLNIPLVQSLVDLRIGYHPPAGYAIIAATAYTPDQDGQKGAISVTPMGDGSYELVLTVDQFAMIALDLEPEGELCAPPP